VNPCKIGPSGSTLPLPAFFGQEPPVSGPLSDFRQEPAIPHRRRTPVCRSIARLLFDALLWPRGLTAVSAPVRHAGRRRSNPASWGQPWPVYGHMSDRELEAIYEFLRAIPMINWGANSPAKVE
jgi:hypothetical protein